MCVCFFEAGFYCLTHEFSLPLIFLQWDHTINMCWWIELLCTYTSCIIESNNLLMEIWFAIMNNVALKTWIQRYICGMSFGYKIKRNIIGSNGRFTLVFLSNCYADPQDLQELQIPTSVYTEFHFPNIFTRVYFHTYVWWWPSWLGMKWNVHAVLNFISLMLKESERNFPCIYYPSEYF